MNARIVAAAVTSLAAIAGGCSDDSGILVEIHGDQLQVEVARLDTMVFVDESGATAPTDRDWGVAERVAAPLEAGANLAVAPYELMLRPEGVADGAQVWISALAYDGSGAIVGFGELGPLTFAPDLVKRYHLDLVPARVVAEGCVAGDGGVVVRNDDDCDDDGFLNDTDCDDLDPLIAGDTDGDPVVCDPDCDQESGAIYPGAAEVCDGVDNDCDPLSEPPPELCAVVVREGDTVTECSVGERRCNDDLGVYGPCLAAPVDPVENAETCEAWAACNETGEEGCLVDARLHCKSPIEGDSGIACVPATYPLRDLVADADQCSWQVLGPAAIDNWDIGLRPRGADEAPATTAAVCDAELVVAAAGTVGRLFVLRVDTPLETRLFSVFVHPERVDCDPRAGGHELLCTVSP